MTCLSLDWFRCDCCEVETDEVAQIATPGGNHWDFCEVCFDSLDFFIAPNAKEFEEAMVRRGSNTIIIKDF